MSDLNSNQNRSNFTITFRAENWKRIEIIWEINYDSNNETNQRITRRNVILDRKNWFIVAPIIFSIFDTKRFEIVTGNSITPNVHRRTDSRTNRIEKIAQRTNTYFNYRSFNGLFAIDACIEFFEEQCTALITITNITKRWRDNESLKLFTGRICTWLTSMLRCWPLLRCGRVNGTIIHFR